MARSSAPSLSALAALLLSLGIAVLALPQLVLCVAMTHSEGQENFDPSLSTPSSTHEYEVFVSFRGADIRTGFISHFFAALNHERIGVYRDDIDLPRGGEIGPELFKAIETSRIAVVVFSKSYATSDWCLDELVKIMECKRLLNQRVLPIFYDVSQSEVLEQKGIFAEELLKGSEDKVNNWRAALTEAADLAGLHLEQYSLESEFIEEIVENIWKILNEELADTISWSADQAKFMRKRVNISIDRPLRNCGIVISPEGGATQFLFCQERLLIFCHSCGTMGHDGCHSTSNSNQSIDPLQYGEWLRAQVSNKTGGPKEGPLKASVSLSSNNSNGDLIKERTPEMAEMGGQTADNSGEEMSGNLNGEKAELHLIEVSEEGENNMQRSVQFQIQKNSKDVARKKEIFSHERKDEEKKGDIGPGSDYESPMGCESGIMQHGEWFRAQVSNKTGGPKEGPLKASVSLSSNNSNGDLRKERTPEIAEMGGQTADNSGEKMSGNLNGEKAELHLIEVSEEGKNNMQRSVQFQIQKNSKDVARKKEVFSHERKDEEKKGDVGPGSDYESPMGCESGIMHLGQGDHLNKGHQEVASSLKCLNEDNREIGRDKEGGKAQNRKERFRKLAQSQPNINIMEMETTDNLSGTQRNLWNEEEATNEGKQNKSCTGGIAETPCPYRCVSYRHHKPHCYTALEELIYTFGAPCLFGLLLMGLLVLLALVLSATRMKFVGVDELPGPAPTQHGSQIDHSFPFLESSNEVLETNRAEESQSHVHRMYFMGPNTFSEPWHLPHTPPEQIKEIVYEGAFNTFVDDINAIAAYQWWEGAIYSILSVLAYPLAWSWQLWRRSLKLQRLREFVISEYDHVCVRSCRPRALNEGIKVAATSDLMLAYVDFFLRRDEKRTDLLPRLHQRFPMLLPFGGDGSYMAPFSLHSNNTLTSLMSQSVPPTTWYRLVAGLNAQLRLVCRGRLRVTFQPVLRWLETHANPALGVHGIHVDLAWFQATACGYFRYGLLVYAIEEENDLVSIGYIGGAVRTEQQSRAKNTYRENSPSSHLREETHLNRAHGSNESLMGRRRTFGSILDAKSVQVFKEKREIFYLLSFILHNTKPVGHQDLVGLVISMLLLGDFNLVLLTLLQLYSFSLLYFFLVLFILPLGILLPFPAGINALFSHGPRRSAGLARVYALWNIISLINVVISFLCGYFHHNTRSPPDRKHPNFQPWNVGMDESEWWIFPAGLVLCKFFQSRLINWHVANLEIQDRSLYSDDFDMFWNS